MRIDKIEIKNYLGKKFRNGDYMTYEQQKREYDAKLLLEKILGRNRKLYETDLKKLEKKRKKILEKS